MQLLLDPQGGSGSTVHLPGALSLAARLHPTQHQQQIYSALHLVHPIEKLICWLKKFFIFQPDLRTTDDQ